MRGQAAGKKIHEILAAWDPSHQSFFDLATLPGADTNCRLRAKCDEYAAIQRFIGDKFPFCPLRS